MTAESDRLGELSEALDRLIAAVESARIEVESGRTLELTGLDAEVAALCRSADALGKDSAAPLLPRLGALLEAVDRLGAQIERRPDEEAHRRAASSYARRST